MMHHIYSERNRNTQLFSVEIWKVAKMVVVAVVVVNVGDILIIFLVGDAGPTLAVSDIGADHK